MPCTMIVSDSFEVGDSWYLYFAYSAVAKLYASFAACLFISAICGFLEKMFSTDLSKVSGGRPKSPRDTETARTLSILNIPLSFGFCVSSAKLDKIVLNETG